MLKLRDLVRPVTKQIRTFSVTQKTNSAASSSQGGDDSENVKKTNDNHPIKRTFKILKNDVGKMKSFFQTSSSAESAGNDESRKNIKYAQHSDELFQTHCDILVIGGGGVGASVAFWLKQKAREGLNVVVVERDSAVSELLFIYFSLLSFLISSVASNLKIFPIIDTQSIQRHPRCYQSAV